MKKPLTWWIEFEYSYEILYNGKYLKEENHDSGRFMCPKKDMQKAIRNKLINDEFNGCDIKNLEIKIDICYPTTEFEI